MRMPKPFRRVWSRASSQPAPFPARPQHGPATDRSTRPSRGRTPCASPTRRATPRPGTRASRPRDRQACAGSARAFTPPTRRWTPPTPRSTPGARRRRGPRPGVQASAPAGGLRGCAAPITASPAARLRVTRRAAVLAYRDAVADSRATGSGSRSARRRSPSRPSARSTATLASGVARLLFALPTGGITRRALPAERPADLAARVGARGFRRERAPALRRPAPGGDRCRPR